MALSSFVYISDVENLSDARYSAGMGVDLLGFKLDPTDDSSLKKEQFNEISEWISGVKIVGEFGDTNPEEIRELINNYKVDYLMISNESQIYDFSMIGIPLIYKMVISNDNKNDLDSIFNYCSGTVDYFLMDSDQVELNETDKALISKSGSKYPIILGYGITINNAKMIVDELNLAGICLKGSPELRPGYKDFEEMADILEALEVD